MFSLVIAILSILLVVALAIATVYYGGKAFNKGDTRVAQAQAMNAGTQISAAAALHYAREGVYAPDIQVLLDTRYLTSNPMEGWSSFKDTAYINDVSKEWCLGINKHYNVTKTPLCSDPAIVGKTVCCVNE